MNLMIPAISRHGPSNFTSSLVLINNSSAFPNGSVNQSMVPEFSPPEVQRSQALANGKTPLLEAAQKGHVEIVRCLLEAGANKDLASDDGVTPLLLAAEEGGTHWKIQHILPYRY